MMSHDFADAEKKHAEAVELAAAEQRYNMLFNTTKSFLNTLVETEAGPSEWPEYQALLDILYPDRGRAIDD